MTQNGSLSTKQQQFLLALLSGQGVEQAAMSANVSPRTAYRWQKLPDFQSELSEAKRATFDKHLAILKEGVVLCLDTLRRNMGAKVPPHVQVAAAKAWLEQAITLYKVEALELALADVEDLLKEGGFSHVTY